jgi:hypothetical protein
MPSLGNNWNEASFKTGCNLTAKQCTPKSSECFRSKKPTLVFTLHSSPFSLKLR